jgi:hypothetical protein
VKTKKGKLMVTRCKKIILKKFLCIALFAATFSSFIGVTVTVAQQDDSSDQTIKFWVKNAMKLMIYSTCGAGGLVEGFNIMCMGSTSAQDIKNAARASEIVHKIKLGKSGTTSLFMDDYFMSKDKEKVENSKAFAAFYDENKKYAVEIKNKRPLQAILLAGSTIITIGSMSMIINELTDKLFDFDKKSNHRTLKVCGGIAMVVACFIVDFFRKKARYGAEFSKEFEEWLSQHPQVRT